MHTSTRPFGILKGPGALLALFCNTFLQSKAIAVNKTIDDVFGDSDTGQLPVFLPRTIGVWKDQTCADCSILPDKNQAFDKTFTSATYNPGLKSVNVTMEFDGTAIYVFFILANNAGAGITSNTDCVFKLDGTNVGSFQHVPNEGTTALQYNTLAFSKTGIPNGHHQLVIATENFTFSSYINFDHAIYTHEIPSTSSVVTTGNQAPTSSPAEQTSSPAQPVTKNNKAATGAIVGGVIGGLAFFVISLGIIYWFYIRHRRRIVQRIDLLGSSDDLPGTTNHNQPRRPPPINPNLSISPTIVDAFAATGTPSANTLPQISESSSQYPISSMTTREHQSTDHLPSTGASKQAPFRVVNPGPPILERNQSQPTRQAQLKKQLTIMRGEIDNLKAGLKRKSTTGKYDIQSNTQLQEFTMNSELDDSAKFSEAQSASVPELEEQIRVLMERVAVLQDQQTSLWAQGLTDESPPGYTPMNAPAVPDREKMLF